jgi:hypothetical protein
MMEFPRQEGSGRVATDPKVPHHPNPPPLVRISGTHREIGRQIGEACRKQVQHRIVSVRKLLASSYEQVGLTWEGARIQAHKYTPFAQECHPSMRRN